MPRGLGDIPSLRLERLQKFVTKFQTPPNLVLSSMFPSRQSDSSTIKWESQEGSRGMSPFKPAGAPTQKTAPLGVAEHSAEAAFWGDKMFFDEEFLNNLRKEGTESTYLSAEQRLSRELAKLVIRAKRRREWMFVKMLFSGSFDYDVKEGYKASVDYSLPSASSVSLGATARWNTGTNKDILGDIIDGKNHIEDECGGTVDYCICNSTVLKYLAFDETIQNLLSKSTFGSGDLFKGNVDKLTGVNPKVIAALLDIPNIIVYNERFEVREWLTGAVTGGSTTSISVADASDFEAGATLRFVDVSAGTYEEETIASVDVEASTVTVSSAPTASFKAAEDYVTMRKKYIGDTKFSMWCSRIDGEPISEYWEAPFGLDRHYGLKSDRWEDKDPDGVWIRIEDKGLPVLYQRDAVYNLTVEA